MGRFERLPGFRDFYPEPTPPNYAWSSDLRHYIFEIWHATASRYGFSEYDGPPLEPLELYRVKSGDEILEQLYCFTDKGGREVALRPEMTPTLARMAAAAERHYKKPLKWYSIPQLFRYERQQRGRLREHFQFNADIIGEPSPSADAELIALLIDTLRSFGFGPKDVVIRLSSRQAWEEFYLRHGGNPEQAYLFYQAVDKMGREPEEVTDQKLRAVGISLEQVKRFIEEREPTQELDQILQELELRGLRQFVEIDYRIVRGLAYYTGVVYEAFDREGKFRAIAGGGRYDNLLKVISGGRVDLPALGFGMGDVVLTELLKEKGLVPPARSGLDVYVLIEDESLRPQSTCLVQRLREAGLAVDYPLGPCKSDKQYKYALDRRAKFTIRYCSEKAGVPPRLLVKDVQLHTEEVIDPDVLIDELRRRLKFKGFSRRKDEL